MTEHGKMFNGEERKITTMFDSATKRPLTPWTKTLTPRVLFTSSETDGHDLQGPPPSPETDRVDYAIMKLNAAYTAIRESETFDMPPDSQSEEGNPAKVVCEEESLEDDSESEKESEESEGPPSSVEEDEMEEEEESPESPNPDKQEDCQEDETDGWVSSVLIDTVKSAVFHLLNLIIHKDRRALCHGCTIEHPSQRQHDCLEALADNFYGDNFYRLMKRLITPRFIPAIQRLLRARTIETEDFRVRMVAETLLHELKLAKKIFDPITEMYDNLIGQDSVKIFHLRLVTECYEDS